jgi:hypothetical protein
MAQDSYVVAVTGISALRDLETIPDEMKRAALQAVNKTLARTRTSAAREMRQQVNFPARYLSGADGRLTISKQATGGDLEGAITARFRPTSLARFASGGNLRKAGVRVEVAPGFARFMKRAFLIKLRVGNDDLDTRSNIGLAIRLKPGEVLHNKIKMVKLSKGLFLLFGPSVDQVFATVADDEAPAAGEFLETEFLRLMELKL